MKNETVLKDLFWTGIRAVNPYTAVKEYLKKVQEEIKTDEYQKVIVIGFGKAAYTMAKAVEEEWGDLIDTGLAITKYGHGGKLDKIKITEAGHPLPDENGVKATEEIIKLIKANAGEKTLILCLISGGGSALLVAPYEGITLAEKQSVTQLLLKAGADITELNAVRKHLSRVKGGRLAERAYPSRLIALILSDVIGDPLEVIASGPTAPDETTYRDALTVLKKFSLFPHTPPQMIELLEKGKQGLLPETLKKDNPIFKHVTNMIIGNNRKALNAVKAKAFELGFQPQIISSEIQGEAREVGEYLANLASEAQKTLSDSPKCLISGGETTVAVKGKGLGGRNMELALAFALKVAGKKGISLLSAGSDGTDGPTDAAGAIVDGNTILRAREVGIVPEVYLGNNDAYHFFQKVGGLFISGPTGTNVMDIQIILIEKP
ncbi:MAG: glycerate kinase [Candidatus Desulfofervidaceae bacterium]|nr:glycerate kinase [Candidatus Desulfofervidaceae bacterium]